MMKHLQLSLRNFIALITSLLVLGACSSVTTTDTVDYKASGAPRGPNLAYPPDLITAQADRRYIVQDGTATMSEYNAAVKKSSLMRQNV